MSDEESGFRVKGLGAGAAPSDTCERATTVKAVEAR